MRLTSDKRQKNQLVLAFLEESRSEAPTASEEGTETLAAKRKTESPAIGERLMEEVCEQENCKQALARVKANKGSPGVDGQGPCRYRGGERPRSVVVGKQSGPRYRAAQRLLNLAWDSVFDWTPVAQPTESPYTDPYVR